ncbi:MAG: aminopeptidase [Chloroflexota bacterium]|nr:aminopeptidase [Chloroflexota bacterium]
MADPRHVKLAQVLVRYSLNIQPGDKLLISSTSPVAAPLVREAYREAIRAGALVVNTRIGIEGLREILLRESTEEQLRHLPEISMQELEYYNTTLTILADENTKALSGVDPQRMAIASQTRAPWLERWMELSAKGDLRWCLTLFPTHAYAQDAGMSLTDYEEFVYGSGLLHEEDPVAGWRRVHEEQQRVADFLGAHDEIRIVAPDTDITYRVAGRKWINASGDKNFPDGEVFTGPIEDSVQGHVRFTYPAVYAGNEVEDIRLTFENGRVIQASAGKGEEFLLSMLDQDEGARYLGEVAFGLNYGIQKFSRNILFDEKIGGTMHMALGSSYPETGGKNQSGLHWDMICDLREGKVYADGQLCYEGGRFTI